MVNIGNVNNAGSERRGLSFLVFIGIIGFSVARGIATFFTNYLWFDSVNLNEVWVKILLTRLGLVGATTTIAFAFIFINLRLATRATPVIDIFEAFDTQDPLARFRSWVSERFARFRLTGALALSLFLGAGSSTLWEQVLLFINQENFNITDPVFNNDISNYIFGLPLYRLFVSWGFQLITLTSIVVVLYFIATGAMQLRPQKLPEVSSGGKAHLSVLLAFVAILKAVAYRLDAMELLYSPRGKVFGASYTDVTAHLPALQLLVLISLFGAGLLLVNIRRRGWLLPATALGLWLAVSIVVGGVVPSAIQRFRVLPDELNKELPYVEEHIDYTRLAYGLDAIEERPFEASPSLSNEDITQNAQTVNNIRLWDPTVLAETYSQLQEIRAYYALDEVDVDRYTIDGKLTQVMVSARELDQTNLPAQGWVNQRLQYTHGYGVVFSPANNVASQGQPDFYVKGVPATTTAPELEVSQPRIYFGESAESQEYVVVNSLQEEVDYPLSTEGQSVAYTNYSGQGGVGIGYLLYSWAYLSDSVDLYPKEVILPKGVTPSELSEISLQNMRTSENVAIAVALNSLGYDVQSEGDGVLVVGILDDSPVKDKLLKDDLITSISGEDKITYSINSSTQFISLLRTFSIGETVYIGVQRNDKEVQIETQLIEHIEYKNEPMVGFLASTPNQRFVFPINVDIDTGSVGGPSAGLMMALNVYNKLTEADITNSTVIAGTGTIEIDGSVGPVGGVKQKVIAAKKAGATLILVPTANYQDAKPYEDNETLIVAVETFDNALKVISEYSSR